MTKYYRFITGITSVRLLKGPGHDRVEVWQRGGKCGELTVDSGTGLGISRLFTNSVPAVIVRDTSKSIEVLDQTVRGQDFLFSEDGELVQFAELVER